MEVVAQAEAVIRILNWGSLREGTRGSARPHLAGRSRASTGNRTGSSAQAARPCQPLPGHTRRTAAAWQSASDPAGARPPILPLNIEQPAPTWNHRWSKPRSQRRPWPGSILAAKNSTFPCRLEGKPSRDHARSLEAPDPMEGRSIAPGSLERPWPQGWVWRWG